MIPHLIVLTLWSIVAEIAIIIAWFAALFTGRVPAGLHNFIASWLRYATHVYAYLVHARRSLPAVLRREAYPIDLQVAPPEPQNRWKTFFRIILAIPALIIAGVLRYLGIVDRGHRLVRRARSSAACRRACAMSARGRCASISRPTPTRRC